MPSILVLSLTLFTIALHVVSELFAQIGGLDQDRGWLVRFSMEDSVGKHEIRKDPVF